jgi:hypothetical protein
MRLPSSRPPPSLDAICMTVAPSSNRGAGFLGGQSIRTRGGPQPCVCLVALVRRRGRPHHFHVVSLICSPVLRLTEKHKLPVNDILDPFLSPRKSINPMATIPAQLGAASRSTSRSSSTSTSSRHPLISRARSFHFDELAPSAGRKFNLPDRAQSFPQRFTNSSTQSTAGTAASFTSPDHNGEISVLTDRSDNAQTTETPNTEYLIPAPSGNECDNEPAADSTVTHTPTLLPDADNILGSEDHRDSLPPVSKADLCLFQQQFGTQDPRTVFRVMQSLAKHEIWAHAQVDLCLSVLYPKALRLRSQLVESLGKIDQHLHLSYSWYYSRGRADELEYVRRVILSIKPSSMVYRIREIQSHASTAVEWTAFATPLRKAMTQLDDDLAKLQSYVATLSTSLEPCLLPDKDMAVIESFVQATWKALDEGDDMIRLRGEVHSFLVEILADNCRYD